MADDEQKQLDDAKKLPINERVKHANWKVRSAAFEDIRDKCDKVFDEDDPVLDEYVGLFSKAVLDTNAPTLDKVLDALTSFLSKCSEAHASRIAEKTCSNMVSKCLGGRPGTVVKSGDAFLLFVEHEQAEKALAALVEAFAHKVPKVVVAALEVLHQAISAFGAKVVSWQPVLKAAPPLLESKDNKARTKIKEIVLEIARWTGPEVIRATLLDKVRDVIKTELEASMGQAPPERPQPARLTRKAQQLVDAAAPSIAAGHRDENAPNAAAAEEDDDPMDIDCYDDLPPKDILPELKKEFWEGLESKKWSERKGALTALKELASYPKVQPGDFGDVNREIKKIIAKDSNVQVVAEAILCTGTLAKGLRAAYAGTARSLCPVLLDKFKEKNSAVQRAVWEALGRMHKFCFTLQDVVEDVTGALGHTNPKVREETIKWLSDALRSETKQSLQALPKDRSAPLLAAISKCAEDASPSLREAGMALLVDYFVKLGSAGAMDKITAKMDDTRKKKLDEMFEEAMLARGGKSRAAPKAAPAPAKAAAPAARAAPEPRAAPAKPSAAVRSSSSKAAPGAAAKPAKATAAGEPEDEGSLNAGTLSKEEIADKFTELFGEATVAALQDPVWKARLEAMETIAGQAAGMTDSCSVLVQGMGHLPGWGEKNFQVMAKQFEVLAVLAREAEAFSKRDAYAAMAGLVDKVADVKLQGPALEALSNMAEAVGPQFVFSQLHKKAAAHKNPKVLSVTINWMAKSIEEFGPQPLNVKALLDWMKEDLGSANAPVRTSATVLLGVLHRFLGAPLGDMLRSDVKPALMSAIEAEFAKNPQAGGFTPTRVSRADLRKAAAAAASSSSSSAGPGLRGKGGKAAAAAPAAADAFDPDDMLPRTDISDEISSSFIAKLSSANWKERKEAMEAVEGILQAAGYRIQPQVGELMSALKLRMVDTNRNLTVLALQLVGKLAKAMGRAIDRQGRPVLTPAIKNMSDPKILVRAAVVEMLDAWAAVAPVDALVAELCEAVAAPKCSADGRKLALEWLTNIAASGKVGDATVDSVKTATLGSMDKAVEVREASSRLMAELIESVGASQVGQAAHTLPTALKKSALELYAKVSGGSAPSSAPAASSSAPSRPSTAGSTRGAAVRASAPTTARAGASRQASNRSAAPVSKSVAPSSVMAMAAPPSDDGPLLRLDDKKEERARKARFKPAKFEIKADEYTAVEEDLKGVVAPGLYALMTHKDFKKHCEAAELLKANFHAMYDNVISCLDLVFRWAVLRVVDANTQSLVKVLDMLKALLDLLIESEYRISDHEAKALLPALIEKSGHNSDRIRADHREILRKTATLYSPAKVIAFVKDGLESKNNRTRVECAEEIGCIVSRGSGPTAKQQEALQAVAKLVAERDTALRKAVLATMEVVYSFEGDGMWKLLGRLTDQQKSLIEERLKYVDKELAKKGLRAGYRRVEAPADDMDGPTPSTSGPSRAVASSSASQGAQSYALPGSAHSSRNSSPTKPGVSQVRSSAPPSSSASAMAMAPSLPLPGQHAQSSLQSQQASHAGASTYSVSTSAESLSPAPAQATPYGRKSDAEMQSEFIRCLGVLRSGKLEECVEVMKSLCYHFMELPRMSPSTIQLCRTHTDELVRLLAVKTDIIFLQATAYPPASKDIPNSRACKYSLNTLMNIFQSKAMASSISEEGLQDLVGVLLMRLLDKQLPEMNDGQALLKAINVLMIRVLDHSNRTNTFCALIQLLLHPHQGVREAPAADAMEFHWYELVVKCLIKITRALPQTLDAINLRQLLLACHNFFTELGREEIMARGHREDKPLRMVKTLLNELCRHKGQDIYRFTDIIPDTPPHPPLIFSYIELNLGNSSRAAAAAAAAAAPAGTTSTSGSAFAAMAGAANGGGAQVPGIGAYRPDAAHAGAAGAGGARSVAGVGSSSMSEHQAAKNMLAAIFKRIGDKKEPEKALRELHYFMIDHPDIDVNQFLGTASEQFRTFIAKGLARVRSDLAREQAGPTPLPEPQPQPAAAPADGQAAAANKAVANLAELRDRMNKIQGDLNSSQAGNNRVQERTMQDLRDRMRQVQQQG